MYCNHQLYTTWRSVTVTPPPAAFDFWFMFWFTLSAGASSLPSCDETPWRFIISLVVLNCCFHSLFNNWDDLDDLTTNILSNGKQTTSQNWPGTQVIGHAARGSTTCRRLPRRRLRKALLKGHNYHEVQHEPPWKYTIHWKYTIYIHLSPFFLLGGVVFVANIRKQKPQKKSGPANRRFVQVQCLGLGHAAEDWRWRGNEPTVGR